MVNYQNGKIYKIWDIAYTKCYVGSTCESLSKRFSRHKSTYKDFKEKNGNFVSVFLLFEEFGIENCKIELIENYACNSKEELFKREGHYQKECICVNKYIAKGKDITEYKQTYYTDNQDKIKEYQQNYNKQNNYSTNYYQENKPKMKQYGREYYYRKREQLLEQKKIYYKNKKVQNTQ